MKTALASFFAFIPFFVFSQGNYQIADTTKTWNTVSIGYLAFNVAQCGGTYSHKFSGQTTIGNNTYFNVYESTDSLQDNWEQIGYLREDSIDHKVYYKGLDEDGLLYDFNLEVGDSVYIDNYYYDFTDALLICDSIDSININGQQKQRFYFYSGFSKSMYAEIWIEGIGSMWGLLASGYGGAGFAGGNPKLLCCSKNGETIYMDTLFNTCYIDDFYPKITSPNYDTAYLDTPYEFQLQLSDTSNIGSVSWWGEYIPDGFSFDATTGVLSGVPTSIGSFPCGITITNNDIGLITDMLEAEIVVVLPEGIGENTLNNIQIFPNPASGLVNIKSDIQINDVEVYNYAGQLIWDIKANNNFYEINTSQFESGIYLFRIEAKDGVISRRIVVQ